MRPPKKHREESRQISEELVLEGKNLDNFDHGAVHTYNTKLKALGFTAHYQVMLDDKGNAIWDGSAPKNFL